MKTIAQLAIEVDRSLKLNLNSREFQILCKLIQGDPESRADALIAEGRESVLKKLKDG